MLIENKKKKKNVKNFCVNLMNMCTKKIYIKANTQKGVNTGKWIE